MELLIVIIAVVLGSGNRPAFRTKPNTSGAGGTNTINTREYTQ